MSCIQETTPLLRGYVPQQNPLSRTSGLGGKLDIHCQMLITQFLPSTDLINTEIAHFFDLSGCDEDDYELRNRQVRDYRREVFRDFLQKFQEAQQSIFPCFLQIS